jgi:hypothetical protein
MAFDKNKRKKRSGTDRCLVAAGHSELVGPVRGAADAWDASVLLLLRLAVHLEGGAAHLAVAVHARHGLDLMHGVFEALQPAGGGVEAT